MQWAFSRRRNRPFSRSNPQTGQRGSRLLSRGLVCIGIVGSLLCFLWNLPTKAAQTAAIGSPKESSSVSQSGAAGSKRAPTPRVRPASPIQLENVIQSSKIRFTLRNSISPKRYTFETMAGGVALLDYNNDGLLDIFFTNGAAIPSLEKSNPSYWNRLFRNNVATTAGGYNSSSDKRVHFGLGTAPVVDTIKLTWPSGIKQVLKNVKADQILTVTETSP